MIFGVGSPKMVYDGTTVNLTHASIKEFSWQQRDELEHISVINGNKTFIRKGDYAEFILTDHLCKYANPSTQFTKIYNGIARSIYFYPHADLWSVGDSSGYVIKDSDGTAVVFHITNVVPYYLDNIITKDAVEITLTASKYIDLSRSIAPAIP